MVQTKQNKEGNVGVAVIVKSLEKVAAPLIKKLNALSIKSVEDFDKSGLFLKELKALGKIAKEKEDGFANPAKQIIAHAKDMFRPFYSRLDEIEVNVKEGMKSFLLKQGVKQKELDTKLDSGIISIDKWQKGQDNLSVSSAHVSQRTLQKLEITNPKRIPPKYLIPNEKLIKEDLLKGKKIPGCRMIEDISIAI